MVLPFQKLLARYFGFWLLNRLVLLHLGSDVESLDHVRFSSECFDDLLAFPVDSWLETWIGRNWVSFGRRDRRCWCVYCDLRFKNEFRVMAH